MQRLRKGCLIVTIVGILLLTGSIIYQATLPSARENLDRFAQVPPGRPDDLRVVRQVLLQHLHVGTTEHDIYAFLQQRGATFDTSGLTHCYVDDLAPGIACHVTEDPNKMNFPCRGVYIVQFITDSKRMLEDIVVKDSSVCL
jgi:hypothetical protein